MLCNFGNSLKSPKEKPMSELNPIPLAPQAPPATPQLHPKGTQLHLRAGGCTRGHHGIGVGVGSPNVTP